MEEDSRHPGDPLKYLSMLPPNSESKLTNVTAAEVAWEGHSDQDPKLFAHIAGRHFTVWAKKYPSLEHPKNKAKYPRQSQVDLLY